MKIGIVGCGTMGRAFGESFLASKHEVLIFDRNIEKSTFLVEKGAKIVKTIQDLAKESEIVLLAIKPRDLPSVAESFGKYEGKKKQVILSIMAGVDLQVVRDAVPSNVILLRLMPNLAIVCNQTIIGIVDEPSVEDEIKKMVQALVESFGLILWLPEYLMDPLTAISGSGLAFVFLMMEAMVDAGIFIGFKQEVAKEIVIQVFEGAVSLLKKNSSSIYDLKQQICSAKGTTIYGLEKMEEKNVRSGIIKGVIAATKRGIEMEISDSSKSS